MSLPNINPQTFIPYGVIYANDLDSELFSELLYSHSQDMDYPEQLESFAIDKGYDSDETELSHYEWLEENGIECEWDTSENYHEGNYQGVKFGITSLGGAHMVYIFQSSWIQKFIACSPCVPNAHNIDTHAPMLPISIGQRVEGKGYSCPKSWFYIAE